jgi:hypothetical protein
MLTHLLLRELLGLLLLPRLVDPRKHAVHIHTTEAVSNKYLVNQLYVFYYNFSTKSEHKKRTAAQERQAAQTRVQSGPTYSSASSSLASPRVRTAASFALTSRRCFALQHSIPPLFNTTQPHPRGRSRAMAPHD